MFFRTNKRYWVTSIGLFALLLWIPPFTSLDSTRDGHVRLSDVGFIHGISALRGETGQACKPDRKSDPKSATTADATPALRRSRDRFLTALAVPRRSDPSPALPCIRAPPRALSSA